MMKKITRILLPLLMLGFVLLSTGCQFDVSDSSRTGELSEHEEKIYWTGTIEEDFDDSTVLVMMDKYTGGINKKHDEKFFGDFEKVYVEDLTIVTGDIKDSLYNEEEFRQILEIKLPGNSKENVVRAIHELEKIDGILSAGPNHHYYPHALSNDPYLPNSQWGLTGTSGIQAPDAWDITTGSSSVRVGIIDTGIANHPDLNANVVGGWNFVGNNSNTNDTEGHGTHVAGIVGAVGNNAVGITGVCWDVQLVPLKICDTGTGNSSTAGYVIRAITYADNNDIDIVNMSWGGFSYNAHMKQAIADYNGLFVCSAGNNSRNNDAILNYPSSYRLPNLIAVGAISSNGSRWQSSSTVGSNYGATTVDVFAPGDDILSTYTGNNYAYMPGTSMAAPHVAGVAALIRSFSSSSPQYIKSYIMSSVDKDPALQGLCVAGGRLNAYKAVLKGKGYTPPPYSIDVLLYGQWIGNITVNADGTYACSGGNLVMFKPYFDYSPEGAIENDLYVGYVPWGLRYHISQNDIAPVTVPCTLAFPAVMDDQLLYDVEVDVDITFTSDQVEVSDIIDTRVLQQTDFGEAYLDMWER